MRLLVDIGHPAHVHFFKHFVWQMGKKGHEILIAAKDKEVSLQLLDAYGLKYVGTGSYRKGLALKAIDMLRIDWSTFKVAKRFRPDILISQGSPNAAHVSWLLRKPHIAFENTEHSREQYYLYAPFTKTICTPSCFKRDLGSKQIRYDGCKELAYLHPDYFTPDPEVLAEQGLGIGDRYVVLRFISWSASHDFGHSGLSLDLKRQLIRVLSSRARVVITSEAALPAEFEPYRMAVPPEKIHSLLYYATMYVGEGGTMATEAAVLGTPAFLINPEARFVGLHHEFQNRYGVLSFFENGHQAIESISRCIQDDDAKANCRKSSLRLISEKIDVTSFMVKIVEDIGGRNEKRINSL
jgi:predicted glycosyltransferase